MKLDRRAFLQASAGALAGTVLLPAFSFAKAPLQGTQAPACYRFYLGSFEVTALNDGAIELGRDLYTTAAQAEAEELLVKARRPTQKVPTSINAYLINTGDKVVLVDTGGAVFFGPLAGKLFANLAAAGISPAEVDMVFLTHLHPDHAAGLVADGKPVFPNAEIVVAESEYRFWTDDGVMNAAPADAKRLFEVARASVKPYEARLRKVRGGEIAPGFEAAAAGGHTPGHTMLRVTSGHARLLIWGDVVHTAALQFARPEWAIKFDVDPEQAIATRKRVFDETASDSIVVAGAHLDYPGVGFISREKAGYCYHPVFWSPSL